MSHRENPDGWLGVFQTPRFLLADLSYSSMPLILVAESIEKPGNLGAILRTADAANVDAVVVCDPRVDLWNPNVIRASRGTIFTVKTVTAGSAAALSWLKSRQIHVLAATPSAETPYTQADLSVPLAIVVGTEKEGLSRPWILGADLNVRIPMSGRINSLNVSVAAALILYEAVRQRTKPDQASGITAGG
jgi:TrmH family RNA methyltransferase